MQTSSSNSPSNSSAILSQTEDLPVSKSRGRGRFGFVMLAGGWIALTADAAVLEWKNGETVGGGIVAATEQTMTWRVDPPRFGEPLELRMDVLRSIDLKPDANKDWSKDETTKEPFSIRLDDGTRLFGTITAMDGKNITVQAARFGMVQAARSSVTGIQRMNGGGILMAGPGGRGGWKPDDESKKHLWRQVAGGFMSQTGWNHAAHVEMTLPERVELRLRLRSQKRPEFKLELATAEKQRCVVETWDNEIVLQGREFGVLTALEDDQRTVTLGLFWDRKSGLCSIFDGRGKKLAETRMPLVETKDDQEAAQPENVVPQAGGLLGAIAGLIQIKAAQNRPRPAGQEPPLVPGLTLKNKGLDLTVEELMLREWTGKLPEEISEVVPRVELMDGRVIHGGVVRADAKGFTVKATKGGAETTLPWAQLASAHQTAANATGAWFAPAEASVSYSDGMWVPGKIKAMTAGKIELQTSFAVQPVVLKMPGVMRIDLRVPAAEGGPKARPLAEYDRLVVKNQTLHGTLEAAGGDMPRWKAVGASKSVSVLPAKDLEITRADASVKKTRAEALFYLKSGDIVPGALRAMDEKQLDIESQVVTATHFRPEELHAVHFSGEPLNADGFKDRGWRVIRGTARQARFADQHAEFEAGGSLAHPTFAQVGEMRFNLESSGFSALRVRLFTNGTDPAGKSLNLLFGHMGNEVMFGIETRGDQMDNQNRIAAPRSAPVKIEIKDRTVEVSVNGVSLRRINLTPEMRSGGGVILEPFSLWGNGERAVKITHFEAKSGPGRLAMPNVDPKAREHALLVPRFRRESPPKHVLVAANGDLLRGVIEAGTRKHFAVRSGLETVQVPADRVSAVIWLEKPEEKVAEKKEEKPDEPNPEPANPFARPDGAPDATHCLLLSNGGRLGVNVTRFDPDAVIGAEPRLGEVRIPFDEIHTIRTTPPEENALLRGFREWKLAYAPEPVLPESGGESSPVLHKDAPNFTLPLLAGGDFDLSKERGKVIVLDFWATWCGPCVKSMPDMIAKMGEFEAKKVRFIAVNQAEPAAQVKTFLATRGWKMEVALDGFQRVGQQFGVEGIPHTVVIDTEGKVAFVKTGYSPDGAEKIAEQVRKLVR
jgi:thiol-disulfide isomerase/thioredoxin